MVKKNLLLVAISIACFIFALGAIASDKKTSGSGEKKGEDKECKISKITVEELKKAVEEKKVTIVDTNGTESYAKGHIAGALDAKAEGFDAKLPADKGSLIVLYCGGEKCTGSKDVSEKLTKLGFTNQKCFGGGVKGWTAAGGAVEK